MRYLAFAFLLSAAVDWPTWLIDRAGVALLGLGFIALALPRRPRRIRRAPALPAPRPELELDDTAEDAVGMVAERVMAYLGSRDGNP